MKEENLLRRIELNPHIMLGKPIIKGTRLPVDIVVERMAYGATIEDLKKDYPFLKKALKKLDGSKDLCQFN